jgi:hypothetical protein
MGKKVTYQDLIKMEIKWKFISGKCLLPFSPEPFVFRYGIQKRKKLNTRTQNIFFVNRFRKLTLLSQSLGATLRTYIEGLALILYKRLCQNRMDVSGQLDHRASLFY